MTVPYHSWMDKGKTVRILTRSRGQDNRDPTPSQHRVGPGLGGSAERPAIHRIHGHRRTSLPIGRETDAWQARHEMLDLYQSIKRSGCQRGLRVPGYRQGPCRRASNPTVARLGGTRRPAQGPSGFAGGAHLAPFSVTMASNASTLANSAGRTRLNLLSSKTRYFLRATAITCFLTTASCM
jgi:hypothetical protein